MIGPGQLADDRTLEALDFAAIRDRVVAATRTQRGRSRASALLPSSDFAEVGREQAATHAVREAVTGADFYVMPAMDTAELTQAAALGRVLGTLELRAVGDAVASAASAHAAAPRATRSRRSSHRTPRSILCNGPSPTRSTNAGTSSIAPRRRWAGSAAGSRKHSTTRAIAWGPSFAPLNMPRPFKIRW